MKRIKEANREKTIYEQSPQKFVHANSEAKNEQPTRRGKGEPHTQLWTDKCGGKSKRKIIKLQPKSNASAVIFTDTAGDMLSWN